MPKVTQEELNENINSLKPKTSEWYAAIGKKGGLNNKKKQLRKNKNYYAEIGLQGGLAMKKTRGREFFSTIGKMGANKFGARKVNK